MPAPAAYRLIQHKPAIPALVHHMLPNALHTARVAIRRGPWSHESAAEGAFGNVALQSSGSSPVSTTMEAAQHSIHQLFTTEHFKLFKAQRPYVWEEEYALKHLDDFLSQVGDGTGEGR